MGSCFRPKWRDPKTGKDVPYKRYRIVWQGEDGKRKSAMAFNDKAASKALLATKEKEVERRLAGLSTVDHDQAKRPLGELIDLYAADMLRQGMSHDHRRCQLGFLRRLADWERWTVLHQVRHSTLSEALNRLAAKEYAPKSVNHYRAAWLTFAEWCIDRGYLGENPLLRVKASGGLEQPRRRRAPTYDEWRRWMAVSSKRRALYFVAGLTGLRKSEMRLLERRDVNLDADPPRLELRAEATKARRADRTPLLPEVVDALSVLCRGKEPTDLLFPHFPCNRTIARDRKKAGLSGKDATGRIVNFHSLRYFFCTLVGRKLPIQVVRLLMRHADISTTCRIYLDLGLADVAEAVLRLPRLLPASDNEGKSGAPVGAQSPA